MNLTERRIEKLTVEDGRKDRLVFDDTQRGLAVRITVNGSRSFLVQYTLNQRKHRVPLGSCEALSLAKAREAAAAIMGTVAKGENPFELRRAAAAQTARERSRLTLDQLIVRWQREHLSHKGHRYFKWGPRALQRAFNQCLSRAADDLDRDAIKRMLAGLSPAVCRCAISYGHALYSWALTEAIAESNPFKNLAMPSLTSRERVLSDVELGNIYRATATAAEPFGKLVRVLMLTGQRREEVAGMAWSELAPDLSTWTIPGARTKNHKTHIVPLSEPVRDIIDSMPRTGPLVFPSKVPTGKPGGKRASVTPAAERSQRPFTSWWYTKRKFDVAACVTGWTLHDLRRTLATGLQRLGVRLEVTEAVLNHVSGSRGGIVGVYQRHDWANEKRAALDAWADYVAGLVNPNRAVSENVIRPAFGSHLAA